MGTMSNASNPRRKFYLVVTIGKALTAAGKPSPRPLRELGVTQLEAVAAEHGIDISSVPA